MLVGCGNHNQNKLGPFTKLCAASHLASKLQISSPIFQPALWVPLCGTTPTPYSLAAGDFYAKPAKTPGLQSRSTRLLTSWHLTSPCPSRLPKRETQGTNSSRGSFSSIQLTDRPGNSAATPLLKLLHRYTCGQKQSQAGGPPTSSRQVLLTQSVDREVQGEKKYIQGNCACLLCYICTSEFWQKP